MAVIFFFFSLPQVPARRSKSSKLVCARAWYAPSPSLSSSASCSSQPIRCCGAGWNRSCGIFSLEYHLKAASRTNDDNEGMELKKTTKKKNTNTRDNHTAVKQADLRLQNNWSHQGHYTCIRLGVRDMLTTTGPQRCVWSGHLTIHITLRNTAFSIH